MTHLLHGTRKYSETLIKVQLNLNFSYCVVFFSIMQYFINKFHNKWQAKELFI